MDVPLLLRKCTLEMDSVALIVLKLCMIRRHEMARALDSDDDHPVGELTESDVEMLRRIFLGHRDPRVHEFIHLAHSEQACAEGRDDELLEAPEVGPNMVIEKDRVLRTFLH